MEDTHKMENLYENLIELIDMDDGIEEFDAAILNSHEKAEMLSKKGVKVKMPVWKGLMAS